MTAAASTPAFRALALAAYLVAAAVATDPLARRLGVAVAGQPGDTGFFLWCMDTFWRELAAGGSPFHTDRILVPLGASLAGSNCVPSLALLALPFLSALPLYVGLLTLASLALAGLGMLRLVETLTGDRAAAAVAGLMYAVHPSLLALVEYSHFPAVTAAALVPFGLRAVLLFARTAAWRPLVVASALAWAMVLTHVYPTAVFLIQAAVVGAVVLARRGHVRHLRRAAAAAAANVALAGIWVAAAFPAGGMAGFPHGGTAFTSSAAVDLADTLVPSGANPLLGGLHAAWASDANGDVASYFLGWGVLALALLGGAAAGPRARARLALAVAGGVTLALATGTAIRVADVELASGRATPFFWLATLPFFELLDSPRRLIVGTAIAVIALAGAGIATLAARTGRRGMVVAAALALAAVELGQVGASTWVLPPLPRVYERVAAAPHARTVLELGGGVAASNMAYGLDWSVGSATYAWWQMRHGKPRVGGYLSRVPAPVFAWFQGRPVMGDLLDLVDPRRGTWAGRAYGPREIGDFLATFDLGWIVVPPSRRHDEYVAVVEELLGPLVKRHDADGWTLYRIRRRPGEGGVPGC